MTGRHRAGGRHRAPCTKPVSMWPRIGFIGALALAAAGPAFAITVYSASPAVASETSALSSAQTVYVPALPVLPPVHTLQPRVDLVNMVQAAINGTGVDSKSGDSEGGSHHSSSSDSTNSDSSNSDTGSGDSSSSSSHHHHSSGDSSGDATTDPTPPSTCK